MTILIGASACGGGGASYGGQLAEYRTIVARRPRAAREAERALEGERLERQQLIAAVLDRNPSVASALQAWRAALARYRQAGAYEDPMLMASFAPLSIGSSRTHFGYEVEISQRIPLGGKLGAQAAIADAEAQSASRDYAETRLKLALIASELYDDYALALRSLEIQAQHVALVGTLKENLTSAYESGSASAQDALQADAELARLEYQQTVFEMQRDIAVAQLNALLHRAADAPLPAAAPERSPRDEGEIESIATLSKRIDQRPDIMAAQARVRVARARVVASEREFYPDLTLSTSYNSMWAMPEHRWMAGVTLDVPLQRARRYGGVDEALALRAASESEVLSMSDAARSEVAVAQRQLQQARRAVQLYEQRLVPVARARIEAARSGFIASQSSFMTVLEAERGLRSAELELEVARADLAKRRAGLDRALGQLPGLAASEVVR